MNAMNRVLSAPKELMRFCQSSPHKKRLKLSKLKDKADSGVRQESNDEFKDYAETTMNELLGWYGYEKLDTGDTKDLNLRHFASNKRKTDSQSCLATNLSRESSIASNKSKEESHSVLSPYSGSDGGGGVGTTADSTGVCRSVSTPPSTTTTESNGENVIENKDCSEDNQNIPPGCIVCAWCAKVGMKLFTLRTATGCKAFCSELCFTQCRRASFKKNKICDWCKHVRHTVNYVDFQDGEQQLQFCSNKCLNQYKMNIFCNETKAHLHLNPSLAKDSTKQTPVSNVSNLITPDLWLNDLKSGDNENSSVNSFKDSSDSESELDLEDSQSLPGHSLKRKFTDIPIESNDMKTNDTQKDNPIKELTTKESKRVKNSNKVSNISRQTSGAKHPNPKHSNSDISPTIDRSSRESKDKSYHSSQLIRAHRHSPIPPPVPPHRAMIAPNNNIPLLNGSTSIRSSVPHNSIAPNGSPTAPLFPRLPALGRADPQIRPPIMPSPTYAPRVPPMPNYLGAAQMEMLLRMQSGFAGLRLPMPPFPSLQPTTHPFSGFPNMNGFHPINGSPHIQPSLPTNGSTPQQMYPNFSFMPPITIMTPYPVPIPIPIPIPVPILFPIDKKPKTEINNNNNNQQNISSSNDVTTTSHNGSAVSNTTNTSALNTGAMNASKVESVISKLVEKKTKESNSNKICKTNGFVVENSLSRRTDDHNSTDGNDNQSNGNKSSEKIPQNLVLSRDKRSTGLSLTSVPKSGYRLP